MFEGLDVVIKKKKKKKEDSLTILSLIDIRTVCPWKKYNNF